MKPDRFTLGFGIVLIIAESACFAAGQIVAGCVLLFVVCFLLVRVATR